MKVLSGYSWLTILMLSVALVSFSNEGQAIGSSAKKGSAKSSSKKARKPDKEKRTNTGNGKATIEGEKIHPLKMDVGSDESESKSKTSVLADIGFSVKEKGIAFGASIGTYNSSGSGLDLGVLRATGAVGVLNVSNLHIGARYRYGIAKIAFIGGGLGLSSVDGTWYVVSSGAQTETLASGSLKVVTLDAGLGLRLPLGIVLVGADLVDVSIPLAKMGSVTKDPAEEIYAEDAAIQRAKFTSYAGGISIVSKLSIGIAF